MNKASIYFILILLLSACNGNDQSNEDELPHLYNVPEKVALNTSEGYLINQVTGDRIQPLIYSSGDTLVTGKPIPATGRYIDPKSVGKPKRIKAGKPMVIPADQNVHLVLKDLTIIPINKDQLGTYSPGHDTSSFVRINSLGDTIPTGIAVPVKGQMTRVIQPEPVLAGEPRFKDNTLLNLQYIDVDQGMNSSYVLSILEDKKGNLWFGTQSGLSRYDGVHFTHFSKKEGIVGSYVNCLIEDKNGNIWFGTYGGVSMYDGYNFTHFTRKEGLISGVVNSIYEDKNGNIWFGSKGGGVCRYDGNNLTHFTMNEGLSNNRVNSICEDKNGNLWFGTYGGGVNRYNGKSFTHIKEKDGLLSDYITCMMVDGDGNIWFGSYNGVCKYDGKSFTHLTKDEGLSHGDVYSILEDKNGDLWFATNGGGVNRYDGESITYITENEGLSNNGVRSIIEDNSGNLWFGTYGGGINRYDGESFTYLSPTGVSISNSMKPILEDRNGNLWFGTYGGGMARYDGTSFTYYTEKEGLNYNYVVSILEDHKGNIWFGTNGRGVTRYDGEYFTHFTSVEGLCSDHVWSIIEDKSGNIWFGTKRGVSRYNGESFTNFTRKNGLITDVIFSILEDNNGNLWFASRGSGAYKYEVPKAGQVGSFTRYTEKEGLSHNKINTILQDKKGFLWFATWGGISHFDGEYFTNYTEKEGLINNKVWSAVEDKNGNLYFGTEKGLSIFTNRVNENDNREKKEISYKISSFGKSEGLKTLDFKLNSVFIDNHNRSWWSVGNNFVMLDLNNFTLNAKPPTVEMNYLAINEKLWDFGNLNNEDKSGMDFNSLERFYSYPINLSLDHNLNHLTFHFSGIEWSAPNKILYSYKIEGLNEKWSKPSNDPFADYRNIPYGSYVFKVMAIGESQEWSEPFEYQFNIQPPWWHTWWARTSYGAIAILVLMGYGRWRTSSLEEHKKELESEVKKATEEIREQKDRAERSEAFKQQFLANMSHEIRTPMNAVLGMTSLTLDTKLDAKQSMYLNAVKKSSENLLVIINDILDLSKLEAGKMELEKIPFNLKEQIEVVYNTLRFKAEEKGLVFETIINSDVPPVLIGDPARLNQILLNLCGNSIKFTDKGSVSVLVELLNGSKTTVRFLVRDTGIGIPSDKAKNLFSAFHQVDSSTARKYGGTGLGLSISKTLVELQNGEIGIDSEEGKGSEFFFTIPYQMADEKIIAEIMNEADTDISSLKGIRILVAEDNEFNQIVVHDTIKQLIENVTVDIAENGKIAVEKVVANEYDVILMDVNMPEMNGLEATKHIRYKLESAKKDIPILGLTASVLAEDIRKCLESGMNDCIPKPFKREELLGTLSRYYKNE